MPTSIADLLTHLDHLTATRANPPGDAAACTRTLGRLTDLVRHPALGNQERAAVARHFADACHTLADTFEPHPGRLADAAAILADTCARHADHLTDDERWAIITALAAPARRCARVIARSGPYSHVPQLLALSDRAREVLLTAADKPAAPDPQGRLTQPIASLTMTDNATPGHVALETVATLAAQLQRPHPEPLVIRQLAGITVIGELAARCIDHALGTTTARHWRHTRDQLLLLADRPRRDPATDDSILRTVIHGADAFTDLATRATASAELAPVLMPLLQRLATGCASELERTRPNLLVPHGPRPLREQRVTEWLNHQTYRATARDIRPVLDTLSLIAASGRLHNTDATRQELPELRASVPEIRS